MKMLAGTAFAAVVLLAMLLILIDTSTGQLNPLTSGQTMAVFVLGSVGLIGFLGITSGSRSLIR